MWVIAAAAMMSQAVLAPPAAAPAPVVSSKALQADGTHLLVHEVTVEAPAQRVWDAIATADGWKTWAVPVAWATQPDMIETSYSATAAPGDPSTIRQQILFRAAPRVMLFRTVKAPDRFPGFDTYRKVTSLFEVEPVSAGRTRVRLSGYGYADTEEGRRLLGFFERGNRVSLEALRDSFKPKAR